MTHTPGMILVVCTLTVLGGIVACTAAMALGRTVLPYVEGWLARRESRVLSALAMSEDALLPIESKQRARALFLSKLDDRQRRDWVLRRRFQVTAASGRQYTISRYRPFNISARDALFCVQVTSAVPVYDKLLAQKLLVEADEQLFLARANVRAFSRSWEALMASARARYPAG